jgi:hypothetical protein
MRSLRALALLALAAAVLAAIPAAGSGQEPAYAVGAVFDDANRNAVRDAGERGIEGVRVSNGRSIVTTEADGHYRLPVGDDTIIFVIKPSGWMTPADGNNLPRFYYIHKPNGSPKLLYKGVEPTGPLPASVDFPLYRHKEPKRFQAIFFGDTQPANQQQVNYTAHDLVEELVGTGARFGVVLGDIVGNDLSLYDTLVPAIGRIGVPWYYVKGNHDTNYDAAPNHDLTDETFARVFGPSHYSYDYSKVHFVVLNDPYWGRLGSYTAELDPQQMAFLQSDLALVPDDQLVVLMMHIPIVELSNRTEIFRVLEKHPFTFSISGHWHIQQHFFLTKKDGWNGAKPHHHLVNGTACGGWWTGAPDEVGIPHATMSDGTPNGYSVITFDGNKYSIRFKAARRSADYQMNIFAPEEVKSSESGETEVQVNVFAGSERSKVEMRLGDVGEWIEMQRVSREDPFYLQMKKAEAGPNPPAGAKLPGPSKCAHLWTAKLPKDAPAGTYLVTVRTADMFGQSYTASRVIRVL